MIDAADEPAAGPEGTAEDAPLLGRRARRKAETRRRLLDAARELFAERGYHGTRPQDVARAADVAAGTFYVHFPDKACAFLAFSELTAEELMGRIRDRVRGAASFEARLGCSLEALFDYAEHNPGVLGAAFADAAVIDAGLESGASLRDRLATHLAEALRGGMERGELARDLDPFVIAHGIVGMIQAACVHGASRGTRPETLIANLTRFCARALAPAPAMEERS